MGVPGYHGWTHRPKGMGGVDPLDIMDPPYHIKVFGDTQSVATGSGKFMFHIPKQYDGFYLIDIETFLPTTGSGVTSVQVTNVTQSNTNMLSTECSIDASEECSVDAAVPVVIDQANNQVDHKDKLSINVTAAGSGAKGLEVVLTFEPWQIA